MERKRPPSSSGAVRWFCCTCLERGCGREPAEHSGGALGYGPVVLTLGGAGMFPRAASGPKAGHLQHLPWVWAKGDSLSVPRQLLEELHLGWKV